MRPDNTGIKSGYLQNNFRIDKNAQLGYRSVKNSQFAAVKSRLRIIGNKDCSNTIGMDLLGYRYNEV
jgi:hypothetical protein